MSPPGRTKASTSFVQIYDTLPPDAQRTLLESYIVPLLDDLPDSVATKVLDSAKEMQTHLKAIPKLDYQAKRTELEGLLSEIERDQKLSLYIKERSSREQLFEETMDTLSTWINDIWSVIFEYQTNFRLAHQCLILAAEMLRRMFSTHGGCNCAFLNLRFVTSIRHHKTGKFVKTFRFTGVPNFERVLLWTWRELFVSMLASSPGQKHAVSDMLQDIQAVLSWESLPKMVFGGRTTDSHSDLDSEMCDTETETEFLTEDDEDGQDYWRWTPFHADHWPKSANFPIDDVRDLVQQCLVSYFHVSPSLELYTSIKIISTNALAVQRSLLETAESNALWSSDNFIAALSIFANEDSAEVIWKLHTGGAHLIRPRDAVDYQTAVVALGKKAAFRSRAQKICQDQLLAIVREFRAELYLPFSRLYDPARVSELESLVKQKPYSRNANVASWVTAVSTPNPGDLGEPNPMAFAAMMMGLPVPVAGDELGGIEEYNGLDLAKDRDPDLEDLRDEFRPQFKSRFEGWFGATITIGKPDQVFRAVFTELVAMMPFLREPDIVDEMLNRISDKPSKHHICDGFETLQSFTMAEVCKEQVRQRHKEARGRRKGKAAGQNAQASSSGQSSQTRNSTSRTSASRANPGPSMSVRQPFAGFDFDGLDSVD
ncbi:hypothetical protein BJV78DRAFT_59178 [Lactifluus subvellereus]|nr:hypothetical protein BJV78DRAFT_59178 [Lactifluus subvellereus]